MAAHSTWWRSTHHKPRYKIPRIKKLLGLNIFIVMICTLPAFGQEAPFRIFSRDLNIGIFDIQAQDDFTLNGIEIDMGRCASYKYNEDTTKYVEEDNRKNISPISFPIHIAFGQRQVVVALVKNKPFKKDDGPRGTGWIVANGCYSRAGNSDIIEVIIETDKGTFKWNP